MSKISRKRDSDGLLLETVDEDNDEDDTEGSSESSKVNNCSKTLRKRSKPMIIRSVWFNRDVDSKRHHRELLFLFTPWRGEARDIDSFWPYEEKYGELGEQINSQLQE